jgi:amphi-Trp domain-containing protein
MEESAANVSAWHRPCNLMLSQSDAACPTEERQVMKKQKMKFAEQQALDTCIRQLEALLEGLKSGTLSLSQGGEKLWLRPGGAVDIELRAEQSGDRESLEIQLGWRRASLHVVSRPPEDAPPKTVRNWQRPANLRESASRDELPPPSQRSMLGKLG